MDLQIKQAVSHLKDLIRENPDWPFNYCAAKVANLHKMDLGLIISEFSKNRTKKTKRNRKKKFKDPKKAYGDKIPYWV